MVGPAIMSDVAGSDQASGPDDLGWPPQIILDAEEAMPDADVEPTSGKENSNTDVAVAPSFETVACSMALEDISQLPREVPSTQPRH